MSDRPALKFDPKVIAAMTEDERREFASCVNALVDNTWQPLPGPQRRAYESDADIIGYGGAAGGGKTDLGIGLALTKHEVCQIFRREGTEIRGIVDRVADIVGHRTGLGGKPPVWRNPNGRCKILEFGSVPNLGDETKYQGRAKDLLWLDEASNFLESQARFLMGWVRSTNPNQRCRTLLTFNPPTSADGRWIVHYFAPWLDDRHPNPAKDGELRWFATVDGADIEVEDGKSFDHQGELITPQSRTFIASRIADNPFLMGTGYMATLQSMPEPLRSQMLYGDFKAAMVDDEYQVIPTAWVDAAMDRWEEKPRKPRMLSMGVDVAMGGRDKTVIVTRHEGNWFDAPHTIPGQDCKDGPTVAALILARKRDRAPIHIDLFGVGAKPYGELQRLQQQINGVSFGDPSGGVTEDGSLRFANVRSELWWRMREALDPDNRRDPVQLPPDPRLRADLCAPVWKPLGSKIKVESREEIVKRIGRSPDWGTAAILALIDHPTRVEMARMIRPRAEQAERNPLGGHDPYAGI